MICCFFATGPGRCGTLLLSKVLDCSDVVLCNHEHSINTRLLKRSFHKKKPDLLVKDTKSILYPTIRECNNSGKIYGESSGHLYPLFLELCRRYEFSARFILLTRNPESFIRSALARGFFSPDHPQGLEHVIPPRDTEIGSRWKVTTPFEKCAWYWAMVIGMVYSFFLTIPSSLYKIVRIEDMNIELVEELYDFLMIPDFIKKRPTIEKLLSERHNASPGQGDERFLNPFSKKIILGPKSTWNADQLSALKKHTEPMSNILYDNNTPINLTRINRLSVISETFNRNN